MVSLQASVHDDRRGDQPKQQQAGRGEHDHDRPHRPANTQHPTGRPKAEKDREGDEEKEGREAKERKGARRRRGGARGKVLVTTTISIFLIILEKLSTDLPPLLNIEAAVLQKTSSSNNVKMYNL